jgi:hypothetical protein
VFNANFIRITTDDSQYSTYLPAITVGVDAWAQKQANQITFGSPYVYVIHLQLKPPLSSYNANFPNLTYEHLLLPVFYFYASCLSTVRYGMFLPS